MKKLILTLLLLLPLAMQAQRIHAYVTTGVTLSQIDGDAAGGFHAVGNVSGVGALTALDRNYRWGLSVEALFLQRGAYNNSIEPYRGGFKLNYVDIPVIFHYQDPNGGMLLGIGLAYGRLVRQPHGTLEFNPLASIPDTSDLTFLKNDLTAVADFRFTVWRGLQFSVRWQYSLLPIKKGWRYRYVVPGHGNAWAEETWDFYNHSLSLRLLYQF